MKKLLSLFFMMERDLIVGGQAVMEGVMMRTPNAYAIAVRKSDGEIVHQSGVLPKWSDKYPLFKLPILRGGATLIQSMALGVKSLNYSAGIYEESLAAEETTETVVELQSQEALTEGTSDANFTKAKAKVTMPPAAKKTQSASVVGSIIFALGFNVLLFIVAPLVLTNILFIALGWATAPPSADATWWNTILGYVWNIKPSSWLAFNLIDGLVRMAFFVTMIFSMSYLRDIRRVFEYHGAEHKTVFAWEKGLALTVGNAKTQIRLHPRCGTSFLMIVMLVAIVLFSVVKFDAMWLNLVVRIVLLPLVAGISYEIIRLAAKKESSVIFKVMTFPGLMLQKITTQEPDDAQLEVALEALKESLKLEPLDSQQSAVIS